MMDREIKIETHKEYSPGIVIGDYAITQNNIYQYNESKKKHWKKLDDLFYPSIGDDLVRQQRFNSYLITFLHRVFKDLGYIKFTSLFTLANSSIGENTLPGYYLQSQQSKYIGAIKQHLRFMYNDSNSMDERTKRQDSLNEDIKYLRDNWAIDVNINFIDKLIPLEFIYHPDLQKIKIGPPEIISPDPTDYLEKVRTTSEFLTFFTSILYSEIAYWEDFECVDSFYPLKKFSFAVLDSGNISVDKILINVDDNEEYDYINKALDIELQRYS